MLSPLVSLLILVLFFQLHPAFGSEKVDMKAIYSDAKKFALDKEKERVDLISKSLKEAAKEDLSTPDHEACQAKPYFGEGEEPLGCGQEASMEDSSQTQNAIPQNQEDKQEQGQNQEKSKEKIYVFVSFSMPKESLRQLLIEAKQYHAILLLRGLKNNSFKETAAFIQSLGEDLQEGLEINPELFATYQIKKVPVFVLVKEDKEVSRLSGNVTLGFAHQKLHGEKP